MLSLQEMSDRFELQDLTHRYCEIVDRGQFSLLTEVFTREAHIDYTAMGGIQGNVDDVIAFLQHAMPRFRHYQHIISNQQFVIDDDNATGRIICLNPMEPAKGTSHEGVFFLGFWYVDEYVRTEDGWRIHRRVEEKCFQTSLAR